jgi:predicted transcriptional regulator
MYTIKLPAAVGRRVSRAAKRENRNPSDLAAEALRWYFLAREIPPQTPTPAEVRAIRRGEAAYKRGDYLTLDEFRREKGVGRRSHPTSGKVS